MPNRQFRHCNSSSTHRTSRSQCRRGSRSPGCSIRVQAWRRAASSQSALDWQLLLASNLVLAEPKMHHKVQVPPGCSNAAGSACKCKFNAYKLSSLKDSANTSVYVAMCENCVSVRKSSTQAECQPRATSADRVSCLVEPSKNRQLLR